MRQTVKLERKGQWNRSSILQFYFKHKRKIICTTLIVNFTVVIPLNELLSPLWVYLSNSLCFRHSKFTAYILSTILESYQVKIKHRQGRITKFLFCPQIFSLFKSKFNVTSVPSQYGTFFFSTAFVSRTKATFVYLLFCLDPVQRPWNKYISKRNWDGGINCIWGSAQSKQLTEFYLF